MGCHALSTQSLTNMESQTDLFLPNGKHLCIDLD
jgi:hypothetical protein